MSEESFQGEDLTNHTDSNRQIVSRNLDTFSNDVVHSDANNGIRDIIMKQRNITTTANVQSLTSALDNLTVSKFSMSDVTNLMTFNNEKFVHDDHTPPQLLMRVVQGSVSPQSMNHNAPVSSVPLEQRAKRKRIRESPEETQIRIRQKLQQYAYKGKYIGPKNVSFSLQADVHASHSVSSTDSSASSMNVTMIDTEPIQSTSHSTPRPRPREEASVIYSEEQIRAYQVPNRFERIWKLLEAALRKVGRHDARVSQLTQELADDNPPSWCFGGSTAPLHLRPFNDILINITRAYANTMAAAARQLIHQQAQDDQREATSLLNTLSQMYEEGGDPDFALAHQRALGIATHYKEKETQLNRRLHQADLVNQPQTRTEWAETLGRRKVSRPSNRRRGSRSRSPIQGQGNGANNRGRQNQQAPRTNPPPPRTNSNQRQQQPIQQQQQQQQPPRNNNRYQPRPNQGNGNNRGQQPQRQNTYTAQNSASNTNQQTTSRPGNAPRQGRNNPPQPQLDLNAEEEALINMMRAARNNNHS